MQSTHVPAQGHRDATTGKKIREYHSVKDMFAKRCLVYKDARSGASDAMIHIMFALSECDATLLDDENHVCQTLKQAADVAGATLLKMSSHKFEPQGVTAVALLAESHISVHTWPEKRTALCDIFTCSDECQAPKAVEEMQRAFKASLVSSRIDTHRHV